MAAPEGYTPLAIVGYTDKGTYSAGTTYNKYNVLLYDGSSYVAIKDGLIGVTPSNDGVNWRTFANGFPSNGVTTDNFQSTLGNYLANNGTTTSAGFALDARYGKTLQDSVDALIRKTIVVKWWNDNIPRTINGETGIDVGAGDPPTVFPSYPGLTFVSCVGGHGNGEVGLLVSGNKWIFNTTAKQKTYTGITWYLVYKGTEE